MTRDEILNALSAKKMTVEEASKQLAILDAPATKIVGVQFASPAEFLKVAENVNLTGSGVTVALAPRTFSTGSYGWSCNGKVVVTIADGRQVRCQGSINLTVIGSKPAKA
jgi:acyl CoA:acetate/3-ketoacid CoA transferase beta subunit